MKEAIKGTVYGLVMGAAALGAVGCDDGGNNPEAPYAQLDVSPLSGAKPLDATLDASASYARDGTIEKYTFDFGDGTPVYEETPALAPDGVFDGVTTHQYASEGDFDPLVTVTDSGGRATSAVDPVDLVRVGFGADYTGAMDHMETTLNANSYAVFRDDYSDDTYFQLFDPGNGTMVEFYADIKAVGADTMYVLWDWDSLSTEQQDCITNRLAENPPMNEPKVVVAWPEDSPQTLDDLLLN